MSQGFRAEGRTGILRGGFQAFWLSPQSRNLSRFGTPCPSTSRHPFIHPNSKFPICESHNTSDEADSTADTIRTEKIEATNYVTPTCIRHCVPKRTVPPFSRDQDSVLIIAQDILCRKPDLLSEFEPPCFLPNEPKSRTAWKRKHFPQGEQLPNPIEPNRTLKKYFHAPVPCISHCESYRNPISAFTTTPPL